MHKVLDIKHKLLSLSETWFAKNAKNMYWLCNVYGLFETCILVVYGLT
jgi:hypothetical protein